MPAEHILYIANILRACKSVYFLSLIISFKDLLMLGGASSSFEDRLVDFCV